MRLVPFSTVLLLLSSAWCSSGFKVTPSESEISDRPADLGPHPTKRKHLTKDQQTVDAITRLWDGEELEHSEPQSLRGPLTFRHANTSKAKIGSRSRKNLKLAMLGPFDAGTHLLLHTLRLNYPDLVNEACGYDKVVVEDQFAHCRVWKHGMGLSPRFVKPGVPPLETVLSGQNVDLKKTVLLAMVRSPLSQIASWKQSPYDLYPCVQRAVANFDLSCSAQGMTWLGLGDHDHDSLTTFESSMDVYNRYLRMYKQLQESGRFGDVMLITYEDLVLAPEDVITDIAASLGWPVLEEVATVEAPAKHHGHAVGRNQALDKIVQRSWLSRYSSKERALVCRGLDPQAYSSLKENGRHVPGYPVVAYGADCAGHKTD